MKIRDTCVGFGLEPAYLLFATTHNIVLTLIFRHGNGQLRAVLRLGGFNGKGEYI